MKRALLLSPLLALSLLCALVSSEVRADERRAEVAPISSAQPAALGSLAVETVQSGAWQVRRSLQAGRGGDVRSRGAPAPGRAAPMGGGEDGARLDSAGAAPTSPSSPRAPAPSSAPARPEAGRGADTRPRAAVDEGRGITAEEADALDRAHDKSAPPTATPQQAPLRAGSTDDNADLEAFLTYMEGHFAGRADRRYAAPIDVRGRRFVKVVDAEGKVVPAARVTIVDEVTDRLAWTATTQGDGAAPYYPGVAGAITGQQSLVVEARLGDLRARARWDGAADLQVALPGPRPNLEPLALDVAFVIDTTGSMGDEIQRIQQSLLAVTAKLRGLGQEIDLRYGCVLYKDLTDEYLTSVHPFTGDVKAFDEALASVRAGGGGDTPESLNQGLAVGIHGLAWRERAAKVAFVITDASPHMDYPGDAPYPASLQAAVAAGVKVHAVAASGLDADGSCVLRQMAQFTRGTFVFIEYGSTAASAESHGVTGKVSGGNNLDQILFERVRDEVAHWGGR
jgi:hypothetical protein